MLLYSDKLNLSDTEENKGNLSYDFYSTSDSHPEKCSHCQLGQMKDYLVV